MTTIPADNGRPSRVEPDQASLSQVYRHYNIDSIDNLEHSVSMNLRERGWDDYKPTDDFRASLVMAFEDAYIEVSGKDVISEALVAATEDASYWLHQSELTTGAQFESAVCPRFTRAIARILPAYANRGLDTVAGIGFHGLDDDTSTTGTQL